MKMYKYEKTQGLLKIIIFIVVIKTERDRFWFIVYPK